MFGIIVLMLISIENLFMVVNAGVVSEKENSELVNLYNVSKVEVNNRINSYPTTNGQKRLKPSNLKYYAESKIVLAMSTNKTYACAGTSLYVSDDSRKTWVFLYDFESDYPTNVHILDSGKIVVLTNSGRVFVSTNETNLIETTLPKKEVGQECLYQGIDSYQDTVVFATYILGQGVARIYTSHDGGFTWNISLEQNNPSDIRHFHSIQYNPYDKNFYATSGDSDSQVKWWKSSDYGDTWTIMQGCKGQAYRTLSMIFLEDGSVIWGVDSIESPKIYKAKLKNPTRKQVLTTLTQACWGVYKTKNLLVAICSAEYEKPEKSAKIYISKDNGSSWRVDLDWALTPNATFGGFRKIFGSGSSGEFAIGFYNIQMPKPDTNMFTLIVRK
jgi:hypothetical protein